MHLWLADPPSFGGPGQGPRKIIERFVVVLSAGIDRVTRIRQLDDDPD